ncbi:MAG: hypothetical protein IPK32_16780 [Verrucomicrobiaceae bacterium]|nr:hypothetical protein [Verrucomicrobiaceae bacterium]
MAAAFTFKLDDDILGEALEVERQKEAECQKITTEKERVLAEGAGWAEGGGG